jgi:dihydroflavonol-4-reductase
MRVLVTGAAGLLGSNIVRALLDQQIKPVCFVRKSTDLSTLKDLPCDFVFGSLENKEEVELAVQDCDAVIHAASIFSHPGNSYEEFVKANIQGTIHVVEAVLKYDLLKLIYISTANTLAPGTKERPGIELNEFDGFHLDSNYLNTKYIAEQYVLEQVEKKGLDANIINPTFMLGAFDSKPSSGRIITYGINKSIVFVPPGGKNFVHVGDVAKVAVRALSSKIKGEKYLVTGFNYTYKEFFELLSKRSGKKKKMVIIPKFLFYTAAYLVQFLRGKNIEFNISNAKVLGRDNYYSGKKAIRDFKYLPTPIELAVEDALDWFKKNGKLSY